MKYVIVILTIVLMAASVLSAQESETHRVKYLSSENVYLDSGTKSGLAVGDTLEIRSGESLVAQLVVVFAAEHSASCDILVSFGDINLGDIATILPKKQMQSKTPVIEEVAVDTSAPDSAENVKPKIVAPSQEDEHRVPRRFSGSISAQYYHFDDQGESNLDFTQPTLRFNLRGKNLWGRDYFLRIRSRARYNQRTQSLGTNIPETEWRNRIYEVSFSYENPDALLNYRLGRILSSQISGVGYIDGAQLRLRMSSGFFAGVFAGTQPNWRTSAFETTVRKYGAFLNLQKGEHRKQRFESTIAATGEYFENTVSREFLFLRNQYVFRNNFNIYQSLELDMNRGWRQERAGNSVSVSNLFVSSRYRFGKNLSLGVSFDNRRNYWTYQIQSVADSLFDDALRTGLRANLSVRLPGKTTLLLNGGIRNITSGDNATNSVTGSLTKHEFAGFRFFLGISGAWFSSPFTDGLTSSLRLGKSFARGQRLEVMLGNYAYQVSGISGRRQNQWVRSNAYIPIKRRLFLSGEYQLDRGDDAKGNRFILELGIRL